MSYDHRVIDGAEAARFVVYLAKVLGEVKALLWLVEVRVPDFGDAKGVTVVDVLVDGSEIRIDDALITLETEKASMDVPSPVSGVVESIQIEKGEEVSAGTLIATVQVAVRRRLPTQRRLRLRRRPDCGGVRDYGESATTPTSATAATSTMTATSVPAAAR